MQRGDKKEKESERKKWYECFGMSHRIGKQMMPKAFHVEAANGVKVGNHVIGTTKAVESQHEHTPFAMGCKDSYTITWRKHGDSSFFFSLFFRNGFSHPQFL